MSKTSQRKVSEFNHWFNEGRHFTIENEIDNWDKFKKEFKINQLRGISRAAALNGFTSGKHQLKEASEKRKFAARAAPTPTAMKVDPGSIKI